MHQCALSSSTDNGCDAGIRQAWVPLFDQYQVDLVAQRARPRLRALLPGQRLPPVPVPGDVDVEGHCEHRAGPATTCTARAGWTPRRPNNGATLNTFTPVVVVRRGTDVSPFDTSQGTVYMVLGGGGPTSATTPTTTAPPTSRPSPRSGWVGRPDAIAAGTKPLPDASEPCSWSANKDTTDAYGIALFSVDPGVQGGNTTITVTYSHAPTQTSGAPSYSVYDTF